MGLSLSEFNRNSDFIKKSDFTNFALVTHEEIDSKGHMDRLTEMGSPSKQLSNLNNNILAPEASLEGDIKM